MSTAPSENTSLLPLKFNNNGDYNDKPGSMRSIRFTLQRSVSNISSYLAHHTGRIGMLGSMSIAVNSLTGPAMLDLPSAFQRSGFIPTTLVVIFVCFLSSMCSLLMANTISKVERNSNFKREVEYSEVFRVFFGQKWYIFSKIIFFCCVTCLNISSIVDTAQTVDTFLGHWVNKGSGAFHFKFFQENGTLLHAEWVRWDYSGCSEHQLLEGDCIPFVEHEGIILSIGYMTVTAFFVPLALMDLKDNAQWQAVAFLVLLVTSSQFVYLFAQNGLSWDNLSLWGTSWDSLFGVVLFNFAMVIAIPAWLYEKEPDVDVPTVIRGASALAAFLYILIGSLGAMTMPIVADNMLESMMSGKFGTAMQLGSSVFSFFIIGLGIPLFSVLTRLDLTGSGLCTEVQGNILAVMLPFSIAWTFYQGQAITQMLSWGGICFTSVVAFLLPLLVSYHALVVSDEEGSLKVFFWTKETKSKESQKSTLKVLLALAVSSIIAAIVGKIIA